MERSDKDSSDTNHNNKKQQKKGNGNNKNSTLSDVTNGTDLSASGVEATHPTTISKPKSKFTHHNIIDKTCSADKENTDDFVSSSNKPPLIDTSGISGIKKKRASFFTRQFSSFDGSSPIERFQSAIASAASVFSSSIASSNNTIPSSSDSPADIISSSNSNALSTKASNEAVIKNESSPRKIGGKSPTRKLLCRRKQRGNDEEDVSNSVDALLSPSSGAKDKLGTTSRKHRKNSKKKSNFLRRSGSHSPSIKRSPTRAGAECGSSCVNLSVSDRSGPSSGNTTPSPRSFWRSTAPSCRNKGDNPLEVNVTDSSFSNTGRSNTNTLTVPSSSSAYGAIPRSSHTRTQQSPSCNEEEQPRRCFCGHYSEVRLSYYVDFLKSCPPLLTYLRKK